MQRSPHLLPLCLPTPLPQPAGMKAGSQALIFKHCKLKPQASSLQCESLQEKELPWAPLCRRLQHPRAAIGSSAQLPALHQPWGGARIIHRSFLNPFTHSWCTATPRAGALASSVHAKGHQPSPCTQLLRKSPQR